MTITIAIEPYDRHLPLVERNWSTSAGRALEFRLVGQLAEQADGRDRHERFLQAREFDVAELSLSSYLMYREIRDDVIAIPVFPRRLSSFSNVWVRRDSTATCWADLVGSVVGVPAFQMTLGVVARHDMMEFEGVSWSDMTWATSHPENVSFDAPVRRLKAPSLFDALRIGEIDAILTPEIPSGQDFGRLAKRLYGDGVRELELERLKSRGYVPVMHLLAAHVPVLERHPELPRDLVEIFSRAHKAARERYNDPGWGLLFWGRQELESQEAAFGHEAWPHGLGANRRALEEFCHAATQQGLLRRRPDLELLFRT